MKMENIILDLDGTIIDSSEGIWNAFKKSCKAASIIIPTKAKFIAEIGPPIRIMAKNNIKGITESELEVISKTFRYEYDNNNFMQFQAYDGIEQTLEELNNNGAKTISIVTNKPTKISGIIIKSLKLNKYFDDIIGIDYRFKQQITPQEQNKSENIKGLIRARKMNPNSTIYVGDTKMDYISANFCKIKFIAVKYGYHKWSNNELKECDSIGKFYELISTLDAINKQG